MTDNPSVPIIAIPTDCSASEVTFQYVICDGRNYDFVCINPNAIPICAFVDSNLFSVLSKNKMALGGMYSLCNAIESYVTKEAWEMSNMFALKSIELTAQSLKGAASGNSADLEQIALSQYIAGMGFSNVGLGLANAMAQACSALMSGSESIICAIVLPTVMEYNADATGEKYRNIAKAMGVIAVDSMSLEEARRAACDAVTQFRDDLGIPRNLQGIVTEEEVSFLAQSTYDSIYMQGNPKETSVSDIEELYRSLI